MTSDLDLEGLTITMFGSRDALDQALNEEFGRRGCSTHVVTIPVGWLDSASHAVIRLDSAAGERAMEELCSRHGRASTIVAVCATRPDELAARRLSDLCRRCGESHGVSLIWHPPIDDLLGDAPVPTEALAIAIADAIGVGPAWTATPSYASRVFAP